VRASLTASTFASAGSACLAWRSSWTWPTVRLEHVVGVLRRNAVKRSERADLLASGQPLEKGRGLKLHADFRQQHGVPGPCREPENGDTAGIWPAQALDDLDSGGLARAVRAENPEELALLHLKADAVDGRDVSV
jgi:hypothetical protein